MNGLGSNLNLATNTLGDLYAADPANRGWSCLRRQRIRSEGLCSTVNPLKTGLTAPSAVAVDASNNLYVIDGANLFEFASGIGSPAVLLTGLSGETGLAIDPSLALFT